MQLAVPARPFRTRKKFASREESSFAIAPRLRDKPEVKPAQPREPPPAGHLNRRCPACHPAAICRHLGFTVLLFLASWPFASSMSRCRQAQPTVGTEHNNFGLLSTSCDPSLISFYNQLQFRSAASARQPRLALYSLTESERLPFPLNQHNPVRIVAFGTDPVGRVVAVPLIESYRGTGTAKGPSGVTRQIAGRFGEPACGRPEAGRAISPCCYPHRLQSPDFRNV